MAAACSQNAKPRDGRVSCRFRVTVTSCRCKWEVVGRRVSCVLGRECNPNMRLESSGQAGGDRVGVACAAVGLRTGRLGPLSAHESLSLNNGWSVQIASHSGRCMLLFEHPLGTHAVSTYSVRRFVCKATKKASARFMRLADASPPHCLEIAFSRGSCSTHAHRTRSYCRRSTRSEGRWGRSH